MKRFILSLAVMLSLGGCFNDADVASRNLSTAADNFEVNRRVVFYNGITGEYILTIEGLCSLGNDSTQGRVSVTCKVGQGDYKKHFLGVSNNVTWFIEQLDPSKVSPHHYRVVFKPSVIVPDIEVR